MKHWIEQVILLWICTLLQIDLFTAMFSIHGIEGHSTVDSGDLES